MVCNGSMEIRSNKTDKPQQNYRVCGRRGRAEAVARAGRDVAVVEEQLISSRRREDERDAEAAATSARCSELDSRLARAAEAGRNRRRAEVMRGGGARRRRASLSRPRRKGSRRCRR